jgi:hypothetical protein
VELFEGLTRLGTVTADAQGDWSISVDELSDGVHTLTATATDTAANTGAPSDDFTVEVDTAAPAAPVILSFSEDSGVETDALTNDAALTLSGSADPGTVVDLYEGATLLGRADADGTGAWSVTTAVLVDGKHTFTAKATDAAANTGDASSAFDVTIDTAAPGKPAVTAFAFNSGSTADRLTDDATVTLSGTAEPLSKVSVFDGGTRLDGTLADATGAWSLTTAVLADGLHTFHAAATDAAGNTSVDSDDFAVEVDTQAPAAPSIGSFDTNSGSTTDAFTNDPTPTLKGKAEAGATVSVFEGVTPAGTAQADGAGDWTLDLAALVDGDHTFTARATDAADNTGDASVGFLVTVDPEAPGHPTISPFADNSGSTADRLTNDRTPTLSGSAEAGTLVALFEGTTKVG